jgi:hypothetical protein
MVMRLLAGASPNSQAHASKHHPCAWALKTVILLSSPTCMAGSPLMSSGSMSFQNSSSSTVSMAMSHLGWWG